ncbi:MAG: anthranilate phosphoribosyltransferase [Phycisphaera sp.]|nr:anthranilate phosphoribosyltransferase [Phycisphaera sp.]
MQHLLKQLAEGQPLSPQQAVEAFDLIMTGRALPSQVGALLGMIQARGPTADEIVGAARVMRDKSLHVQTPPGLTILDTCGTGGDGSHTFNISTATALVVAGVGRPKNVAVAKHGNRSITSKSGSSQVLEALGVKLAVEPTVLTKCLDQAGLCFCFAPAHHPAMKHAGPIRQELGFRTLFNVLGPLTNPADAKRQLIGVFNAQLTQTLAEALRQLGSEEAMIVHGRFGEGRGIDELSTVGQTHVSHLHSGEVHSYEVDPIQLGFHDADPDALSVESPEQSAQVIRQVLEGKPGPARDIVQLNTAAALVVADLAIDLFDGLDMAANALDNALGNKALDALIRITHEP